MTLNSAVPVAFVSVTSREEGRAFYEGVLGVQHRSTDEFGDFYAFPNGTMLRLTPMLDFKPIEHPVLGWDVADIRATAIALKDKGISFTIYEGLGQDELGIWTAPDGRAKVAFFSDPFGNVLSIAEH
ncbi:VOC family protein [Sphingomonas sp. ID1715]|uniref:VOC family protein n=1 Tax=Sphingomonas sp. ID1715 TaxID=1656898 RepID=UPI001487FF88|nr:VOC family protein [Sphingomonas sp. ID1715]NNM77939.1 VOC family protein [Sphingomonas sp. ID1715]